MASDEPVSASFHESFYEILGLPREATNDEIERAFRHLARKVHPDLNAADRGAEARMKLLNEIRDTLTDPARRRAYDARLDGLDPTAAPPEASRPAPPSPSGGSSGRVGLGRTWKLTLGVFAVASAATVALFAVEPSPEERTTPWRPRPALELDQVPRPPPAPVLPAASVPPPPPVAARPVRVGPRARAHVRIGTRADEVIRELGAPDRIAPGARAGDATFFYGRLRLELVNGRVAGGGAAR